MRCDTNVRRINIYDIFTEDPACDSIGKANGLGSSTTDFFQSRAFFLKVRRQHPILVRGRRCKHASPGGQGGDVSGKIAPRSCALDPAANPVLEAALATIDGRALQYGTAR